MKILLVIFFISFQFCFASNNNSIQGKVTTANPTTGIPGVNVYLSETSIGTMSDANGNYKITNIPPGNYILTVSSIGYASKSYPIKIQKGKKYKINFSIEEKVYEFGQAVVITTEADEWQSMFEVFRRSILGITEISDYCFFENKEKINFFPNDDGFTASCPEPIILVNNKLGYIISFELLEFKYFDDGPIWKYRVLPIFYELDTLDNSRFIDARIEQYFGSERDFWKNIKNVTTGSSKFSIGKYSTFHHGYDMLTFQDIAVLDDSGHAITNEFNFDKITIFYQKESFENLKSQLVATYGSFEIDENGYTLQPYAYRKNGYWGKCGMANMLPKNFQIEDKKRE